MKPRHAHNSGDGKKGKEEVAPWLPLFKMQLKRLEGVGELSLCRMALLATAKTGDFVDYKSGRSGGDDEAAGATIMGQSTGGRSCSFRRRGEIVFADWRLRQLRRRRAGGGARRRVRSTRTHPSTCSGWRRITEGQR